MGRAIFPAPMSAYFQTLTPTTSPEALTSGPPELPGSMSVFIWIHSTPDSSARGFATVPVVTVYLNTSTCDERSLMLGWPTASTGSAGLNA